MTQTIIGLCRNFFLQILSKPKPKPQKPLK